MVTISLTPAQVDVEGVRAGDRNQFQVTLTSAGKAIDLTSLTVKAQARSTAQGTDVLDAVIDITDPVKGLVTVRWPGDAVRTWMSTKEVMNGVWDLQVEDGTGDPWTVVAGKFSAVQDVTRP